MRHLFVMAYTTAHHNQSLHYIWQASTACAGGAQAEFSTAVLAVQGIRYKDPADGTWPSGA